MSSSPRVSASFYFCCTAVLCTAVQLYTQCCYVGKWVVCGWRVLLLFSCTAVAQSYCYSCKPPPARFVDRAVDHTVDRAPPPSPGRPWAAVVDCPPSPDHSLARSPAVAHLPSLARHRSPAAAAVARAVFGRHRRALTVARSLARSPSFVCSPAVARPPSLAGRRSCLLPGIEYRCRHVRFQTVDNMA